MQTALPWAGEAWERQAHYHHWCVIVAQLTWCAGTTEQPDQNTVPIMGARGSSQICVILTANVWHLSAGGKTEQPGLKQVLQCGMPGLISYTTVLAWNTFCNLTFLKN